MSTTHDSSVQVASNPPLVIWRLLDGKPGHENQSLGLVNAIKRKTNCESYDISVNGNLEALMHYLSAMWPFGRGLPYPDLIIGAGHGTHIHLLAAKKAYGGHSIVLMQPSLPVAWFDLCVIPEHDAYHGDGHYIETRGVLNTLNNTGVHHADKALIMIGGPSRHYEWDTKNIITQIDQLLIQNPAITFTLTTSRRTPPAFLAEIAQFKHQHLIIVPFDQTPPNWVKAQLADVAFAWITEDSVSMIYESLTAHVAVGTLNLKTKHENRVTKGVNQLVNNRFVVRFDAQSHYKSLLRAVPGFMEAERCATLILNAQIHKPIFSPAQPTHRPANVRQAALTTHSGNRLITNG